MGFFFSFLEGCVRMKGVNQKDKLHCSLGHLFPAEAVISRPLMQRKGCVISFCVGGLFTFQAFLTGIPLSVSSDPVLERLGRHWRL